MMLNAAIGSKEAEDSEAEISLSHEIPTAENKNEKDAKDEFSNTFSHSAAALLLKEGAINQYINGETALHVALKAGNDDAAQLLIAKGASVRYTTDEGHTSLALSIKYCTAKTTAAILKRGVSIDAPTGYDVAALQLAIMENKFEEAHLLLESGASANPQLYEGHLSPLALAVQKGNKLLVEALLQKNAKPSQTNDEGESILITAIKSKHREIPRLFLDAEIELNAPENASALLEATKNEDFELATLLVEKDADIYYTCPQDGSVIHVLATKNTAQSKVLISLLISKGINNEHLDKQNSQGLTPLHIAVGNKESELAALLLKHGASAKIRDSRWHSCLGKAVFNEDLTTISVLVQYNISTDVLLEGNANLLRHATGNRDILHCLFSSLSTARSPLTFKPIIEDDLLGPFYREFCLDTARRLQDAKNMQCARGEFKQSDRAKIIPQDITHLIVGYATISRDVIPQHFSACYKRNIELAIEHPRYAILMSMIERGLHLNEVFDEEANSLLHLAIKHRMEDIAIALVQTKENINTRNKEGLTPLHLAIKSEQANVVQVLIPHADVNAMHQELGSPIQMALSSNPLQFDVCQMLLNAGAEVNLQDANGNTVLHKISNNLEVAEFLIYAGADLTLQNQQGKTPLWHLASSFFFKELVIKNSKITFNHLKAKAVGGRDDGKSVFWLFINSHYRFRTSSDVSLDTFWDKFSKEITLEDLREGAPSSLFTLCEMAKNRKFTFSKLWEKFKDELTIEDLRESHYNRTIISLLFSQWCFEPNTLYLHSVWDRFKHQMKTTDSDSGFSALNHLLFNNPKNISLLTEFFTQLPGKIQSSDEYRFSLDRINTISYLSKINIDIHKRDHFTDALESAQKEADFDKVDIEMLFSLAVAAQEGCYYNAFYELATWLKPLHPEKAYEAFSHVPKESWHFAAVSIQLADFYFSKAKEAGKEKKEEYLRRSLLGAVNMSPSENKVNLIKKIALVVMSFENETLEEKELPSNFSRLCNQNMSVEAWFIYFNQAKETRTQRQSQEQAHHALLEKLKATKEELTRLQQTTENSSMRNNKSQAPAMPATCCLSQNESQKIPATSQAMGTPPQAERSRLIR